MTRVYVEILDLNKRVLRVREREREKTERERERERERTTLRWRDYREREMGCEALH